MLRGVGAAIALPWLNVMAEPTRLIASPMGPAAREIPQRIGFFYIPNGVIAEKWLPKNTGRDFDLPVSLEPLKNVKQDLALISGLDRTYVGGSDPHAQCGSCWMTSAPPWEHADGIGPTNRTLDQMIAAKQKGQTSFPSIEISCNSFTDNREPITFDSISWYGPGYSASSEKNPILLFQRLFGEPKGLKKSVLDTVVGQANSLQKRLGSEDRQKIQEYLESIRSIEQRIEIQKKNKVRLADFNLPEPDEVPADRGEYIRLMSDLMLMAFQTDSTRVASLMVGPERWAAPQMYPGVFDKPRDHHTMTHDHEFDDDVALIDRFHMEQFAYTIDKMRTMKEANGQSLLDSCLMVMGSGLSEGESHCYKDLPLILAGSRGLGIEPGQHIRYDDETPLANFWLMVGKKFGLEIDSFADSNGELVIPG